MSYQVTARKWRPLVFDDVVGQSHVSNTLRNALAQNRLAHAFIFSGTRGCGKTTTARILARAVNCLNPKNFEPCNECEICKEIIDGRSLDVIEIDGASNRGVDEIRNLRESVRYAPTRGKKKVYIIDEVHMLTKEAFNALLKTLEEPPSHVLFIFATTELHKVPATILSRCQRYDFRRISVDEIVGRLKFIAKEETITIDDDSLLIIAKKGDGSMRDAQSIFDQVVSFCGTTIDVKQVAGALNIVDQELFFRVSDVVKSKETKGALTLIDEVINSGYDVKEFVSGVTEHFRNMLIAKTTQSTTLIEESEIHRKRYADDAELFSLHDLLRIIKVVTDTENSIRFSVQPRFKLEVMMVQLTKMEPSVKIDELLNQIDELKKKLHADGPSIKIPPPSPKFEPERVSTFKVPPSVEEAKPKYTFSASLKTEPVQKKTDGNGSQHSIPGTVASDIPFSTVQQEWGKIVDEMRKKKISVGTILGETTPLEIINGTLRIGCGDEFHRSTLVRNKEILSETINGILSSKFRVEPIIHTVESPIPLHVNTSNGGEQTAAKQDSGNENHPLIKTLYKEFGAERIS
ncbi:MAG: DNA polymerase III subunit gamma/tau [Ignavibacteriales bacterium]|nr:DNA polymerase III subunit gamma/tau [Ignavibacteriales bacterium]